MKKLFLLLLSPIIIGVSLCTSYGQDYHKIDSLKQILYSLPELDGTDADTTRMKVCEDIGDFYIQNDPNTALYWYSLVADTLYTNQSVMSHPQIAKINIEALLGIANVSVKQGNYLKAMYFFTHTLKIAEELDDKITIAGCLFNLGSVSSEKGNIPNAIDYYSQSLKISEELSDMRGIAACYTNLGNISIKQSNFFKALDYLTNSLRIAEELDDTNAIAGCLINLGNASYYQNNYPNAIDYCLKSLKILELLNDSNGISTCFKNLGNVSQKQGNLNLASDYYSHTLKIAEELDDKQRILDCLYDLGSVSTDQGNFQEAINYYFRLLKEFSVWKNNEGISTCYNNLGDVSFCQGNYNDAMYYYTKSLRIYEVLSLEAGISFCSRNLGKIAKYQGNYPDAINYFTRSTEIDEELGGKSTLASDYSSLASAYLITHQLSNALPLFLKSRERIIMLLHNNFLVISEEEREDYLNETKTIFEEFNTFNFNYPDFTDSLSGICYTNELILKGLFLKCSEEIMGQVYNNPDSELKRNYLLFKQYRNWIISLQGYDGTDKDSLIFNIENKANEQERKLVKMSSEFANFKNLFNYNWEDIQKNLKTGEAAIEFVSFTQGDKNDTTVYAALIITPESQIPASVKLFDDNELQKNLGKSTGTGYSYVNSLYGTGSNTLYNLIWKPLEAALTGINTVYYAPVGVLNKISYAALSKEPGKMLCDIYNLQQVSTTGKLIKREESKETGMTAAIFGGIDYNTDSTKIINWNYLPGTLSETINIEKQFKTNKIACTTYSGKDANEENFKALFDSTDAPSILHVSTHGFFYPNPEMNRVREKSRLLSGESGDSGEEIAFRGSNGFGLWMFVQNKNPMMRSGLVFAGANKVWSEDWGRTDNEGVLTAYEVSNMNMRNTDLVVLSACETGLGDIKGSEGVYGLQRAFKMAGVKYIIMSLWQVPDKETVEFMETFYKKLLKTKDVRSSFNETQNEMRKKYDPYYWAAFVLVE